MDRMDSSREGASVRPWVTLPLRPVATYCVQLLNFGMQTVLWNTDYPKIKTESTETSVFPAVAHRFFEGSLQYAFDCYVKEYNLGNFRR